MMIIKKVNDLYKELGGLDAGWYVIKRVFAALSSSLRIHRYKLFAQKVDAGEGLKRIHESITIKQVSKSEYKVDWFPRPKEVIEDRFSQGSVCFVAFKHGEPVASLWLVLGPYIEDEVRCLFSPLPKGEAAWDFDVYIKPEHRLTRIFLYLWSTANQYMQGHGIKWTMSRIDAFNIQSIRSHKRMGAVCIRVVTFVSAGNLQAMLSSSYPFLHVSLSKFNYPTIKLFSPAVPANPPRINRS